MMLSSTVPACRRLIRHLLPTGHPTIERAANHLRIPIRTLQRQLHTAGYTYSQLVEEVRLEQASRLLTKSDARMVDIAALLGFRDLSNFSRAFQRWTGLPPKEFRRQLSGKRFEDRGLTGGTK